MGCLNGKVAPIGGLIRYSEIRCDVCALTAQRFSRHSAAMRRLTIVLPVLDEAAIIVAALQALAGLRARGEVVIVADGGSGDGTPDWPEI